MALADRVVLIADGRAAGEWPVPLPRPRHHDEPAFGSLVRTVLDAVTGPRGEACSRSFLRQGG